MKKAILAFIILIALSVAGYYLLTNLDSIIKSAIEKYGSAATHTIVRVDKVRVKLTDGVDTGSGTIKGLTISNPKGFDSHSAFSLGEITLAINLQSLMEEPYIINEVNIRSLQVFVEINANNKVNLNVLKKNMRVETPVENASKTNTTKVNTDSQPAEPRLKIRKLVFAEGTILVKVVALNNKEYELNLPLITMTHLGGKQGASATEITKEILNRLIDKVKSEVKKSKYAKELEALKVKAKAELKAAELKAKQKVKDEKVKAKSKVDSTLEKEEQKIKSKLEDLFAQ